jgi:hypothetical protein
MIAGSFLFFIASVVAFASIPQGESYEDFGRIDEETSLNILASKLLRNLHMS